MQYLLEQTKPLRKGTVEGRLIIDDTLCEHVGDLFAYADRHYNHAEHSYPLAHCEPEMRPFRLCNLMRLEVAYPELT